MQPPLLAHVSLFHAVLGDKVRESCAQGDHVFSVCSRERSLSEAIPPSVPLP